MTGDHGGHAAMSKTMRDNETFLRAIFGDHDWERAHVCAVAGDPKKRGPGWFGGFAHLMLVDLKDTTNNYFCVSLFTGTRRRANEFLKLVCLVIDDVGPTIEPSVVELLLGQPAWIVESSPGNFQWGYVLDAPITDAAAAGKLIQRIRIMLTGEEGKDPGQESVPRYMRLPTGTNTKEKLGKGWKVRLVKLDKNTKLSTAAVLALVPDIVPGQQDNANSATSSAGGSSAARIGVHGSDTLLAAMRKLGLVLGRARDTAMGWGFDIICPWVAEHTDRAETGTVYVAGAGKFKCHHGHCIDRTVEDLRRKIDEALREAGDTGGLICEEFDVVDPSTVPEPPQGIQQRSQIETEFFSRFVWIRGRNMFYDLLVNCEATAADLDDLWTKPLMDVLPRISVGKKLKILPPSKWMRQDKRGRATTGQVSWPGMPRVLAPDPEWPDHLCVNLWKPKQRPLCDVAEAEVDEKAITLWLQVFWHVVGWDSAEEYAIGEQILDWLALLIGDMSLKAGWHIVISGPHGLGKDSVILPAAATLGSRWAQTVQSQQFGTDFNEWAGGRLVQVSETRQNTRGSMTGHDVMNVLKSVFDNTRSWLTVNPKYAPKYECRNVVMGWFTSNDREPLRLEPGDRRFLVLDRDGTKPLSRKTYTQLHRWLTRPTPDTNITGIMRVAEFLYRRWDRMDAGRKDVLFEIAPMTEAKRALLSRLVDPIEEWIRRSVQRGLNDLLRFPDIVTADYAHSRLETAVKGGEGLPSRIGVPHVIRLGHYLRAAGAVALNDGKKVKVNGVPVVLWAVRDVPTYKMLPPSDLAKVFTSGTSTEALIH